MGAFAQQPDIHVAQHGGEAVRVVQKALVAIGPPDPQTITLAQGGLHHGLEKPVLVAHRHAGQFMA